MVVLKQPLVSVIIPAYNAGKFISETILSIIDQTWKNIEIIIIDDGSVDNTKTIIQEFLVNDARIKYYYQENGGCSSAKDKGTLLSQGDYIQYVDADDILSPDKIEKQIEALGNQTLKLAVCRTVIFDEKNNLNTGIELDSKYLFTQDNPVDFILNLYGAFSGRPGMIQPNAFLMHRTLMQKTGRWNTTLSPSPDEDGEYFCRAILESSGIVFTEGINYYRKDIKTPSLSKGKSLEYALGAFKSVQSKKEQLFKYRSDVVVKEVIAFQFAQCAYVYGRYYKEILLLVKEEVRLLGYNKVPVIGGYRFKLAASFLGFEFAIGLIRFFKKKIV